MAQIYWFLGHEQFQPEVLVRHAKLAETAGFDGVMVSEHFHPWVDDEGAGGFAFATMAAIAATTSRLKIMTAVTTPLFRHHPAVIAQAAATLDRLSGGRFELGIGTGENINEGPLGYEFPAYPERADRMREAIKVICGLLRGEKLDFSGKHYQALAAKLYSPPLDGVPVFLAAGGPKTAALAGELCDGVITSVKSAEEADQKVIEPAKRAAAGRNFKIIANHWTVYAQDEEQAWEALKPWRGLRAPDRLRAKDPAHLQNQADQLPRHEVLGRYTKLSKIEHFVSAYQPLITRLEADIVGIQATSLDQETLIKAVGQQVLPELRKT